MRIGAGTTSTPAAPIAALARCVDCATALGGGGECPGCGRAYPVRDGILAALNPLAGRNAIAARFYDGPGWARFRPWERLFLTLQGGQARARREILRFLPASDRARVLEVGIGDGENLPHLPTGWEVFGVDIARTRLIACAGRFPGQAGRLAWAEAEALPFEDGAFDACYSVGGFNYFRDHAAALAEMRRVTRPGGPVVVADEVPGMHRAGIGHLLGWPSLDARWLGLLGLPPDFLAMVFDLDVDLDATFARALPGAARVRIWNRLGYCQVDPAPDSKRSARR